LTVEPGDRSGASSSLGGSDSSGERRRWPLHTKILVGLMIGIAAGMAANLAGSVPVDPDPSVVHSADLDRSGLIDSVEWVATNLAEPVGRLFLRLVLMVVLPLIFSALTLGVVEIGDVRKLGRVGLTTLGFTALLSVTAALLGIFLVNMMQPGKSLPEAQREALRVRYAQGAGDTVERARRAKPLREVLLDLVPENPLQEMTGAVDGSSKGNGMLAVMVFSLLFGVALAFRREKTQVFIGWLAGLFEVSMVIIGFAMRLAPLAVACLVFSICARMGLDILATLLWFVITVLLGLTIQLVVVYSAVLALFARRRPWAFFHDISAAMLTAFGTSSSNATLPTAMKVAQDELHVPKEISSFVLTIGATGNQNGTALYEGVVVLFLAQVFGVELSVTQQFMVVLMSVLAGIGTAGVPGGSLPMIVIVMQSVGVPGEGIGIILGIDRLLDMCRTVLNVTGDLVVTACVARRETQEHFAARRATQA
jgi:DAACS family dicarboxylate/amino acid:cation (Na+ or H+) symporter